MGQIANALSTCEHVNFPSNMKTNLREHIRAVNLGSEKELEEPNKSNIHEENEKEDMPNKEISKGEEITSNKEGKTKSKEENETVKPYVPLLPFF